MATYECYGVRQSDGAGDRRRSQRQAPRGPEESEGASRASRDSPNLSHTFSRPHHERLSQRERQVSRSRSRSSSRSSAFRYGSMSPEPRDEQIASGGGRRRGARGKRQAREYFGTRDPEWKEKRLDRRRKDREPNEDYDYSGA